MFEHITVDPTVCHGKAYSRGTQLTVSFVLDNLAAHIGVDELLKSYLSLSSESVMAIVKCIVPRFIAITKAWELLWLPAQNNIATSSTF